MVIPATQFDLRSMINCSSPLIWLLFLGLIISLFGNERLFFVLNQGAPNQQLLWLNLTHLGDALVAVALFSAFFLKLPKWLWSLSISIVLSIIIVQGLKHAIDAPRPPAVLPVDQVRVLVPSSKNLATIDMNIDYGEIVDDRTDISAAWAIIESDPDSEEAHYWVPRMNGIVTKEQFGLAFAREASDLKHGTYDGIYRPSTRSFPSGHTTTIICALTLLMLYLQKMTWSWALSFIGLGIAGTRVIVGVHWPIDVAVGGLIGWTIAVLSTWIVHKAGFPSKAIAHRFILLLPFAASVSLLARPPIYSEIAGLEILIGVAGLLFALFAYWKLYRDRRML